MRDGFRLLPAPVLAPLTASESELARRWWSRLEPPQRDELLALWSPMASSCGYSQMRSCRTSADSSDRLSRMCGEFRLSCSLRCRCRLWD